MQNIITGFEKSLGNIPQIVNHQEGSQENP